MNQIFMENSTSVQDNQALQSQMQTLESFIDTSRQVLNMAAIEYKSALEKLERFELKMYTFLTRLNRLLDRESDEYAQWAQDIRGGVYGGTSGGTVACIIADALGALGKTSTCIHF